MARACRAATPCSSSRRSPTTARSAHPAGSGCCSPPRRSRCTARPEQIEEYVRPIVTGQRAWCQLFSEPGAGSDLAGLQCKAEQDGEEWIVNGQKVWTSGGQVADMGMLIARTNPNVPKHQGITYFAIDMHQPGIDVRPLREMTGRAMFNEVFLTDARVGDEAMIGGKNNGWAVANSTLMFERAGLGSGGGNSAASAATPGTVAGDLNKRVGDFVGSRRSGGGGGFGGMSTMLIELAKGNKTITDPTIRQGLMKLHSFAEIGRFNNLRVKAAKEAGQGDPRHGQHLQALDERDDADAARPRPAHRRRLRHAPRLRRQGSSGDRRGDEQSRSSASSPNSPCSRRARRSTAAPTRCSATSSANGCSACPRSRTTTARSTSPTCRRTSDRPVTPKCERGGRFRRLRSPFGVVGAKPIAE